MDNAVQLSKETVIPIDDSGSPVASSWVWGVPLLKSLTQDDFSGIDIANSVEFPEASETKESIWFSWVLISLAAGCSIFLAAVFFNFGMTLAFLGYSLSALTVFSLLAVTSILKMVV